MPHPHPLASTLDSHTQGLSELDENVVALGGVPRRKNSMLGRLHGLGRIGNWLKRDEEDAALLRPQWQTSGPLTQLDAAGLEQSIPPTRRRSLLSRRLAKKQVVPELPRPQTFRRQDSEKRGRLLAVEPTTLERRAVSEDRRKSVGRRRVSSVPAVPFPSLSAPEVGVPDHHHAIAAAAEQPEPDDDQGADNAEMRARLPSPDYAERYPDRDDQSEQLDPQQLQEELDSQWILNLSMHFRDKSDREKFFVTYAQEPNRWRRVTVSCDYRRAELDSLEADLKSLHYQRDKSLRIYEAIRDSLPDIQFYDTVTNLKLETDDGRLHVHVTEDVNEMIPYPSISLVEHIGCIRYRERDLAFQSHLSGFVYSVSTTDSILIKKEIPGPDTVDEFLYEVNALHSLLGADSVIQLRGLVTDDADTVVKGLLISYAAKGGLVDLIYDAKHTDALPWPRRVKWARQIVRGLSEIHEAGFVQGDFTLGNIVIDGADDAKIIDMNRRGCPVGWEPPELARLIESGQRVGMCIGVKSDLFQLGMVLWALAEETDEPERVERPLPPIAQAHAPQWYRDVVDCCLSEKPQGRVGAKELLGRFPLLPEFDHVPEAQLAAIEPNGSQPRRHEEYIDPAEAVGLQDIDHFRQHRALTQLISGQPLNPHQSSMAGYQHDGSGSYVLPHRGRSPFASGHCGSSSFTRPLSSATSVSLDKSKERAWEYQRPSTPSSRGPEHSRERSLSTDLMPPPRLPTVNTAATYVRPVEDLVETDDRLRMGMSYELEQENSVYFGPPPHQDSGFHEFVTETPLNDDAHQSLVTCAQLGSRDVKAVMDFNATPCAPLQGPFPDDIRSAHHNLFPLEYNEENALPKTPPAFQNPPSSLLDHGEN